MTLINSFWLIPYERRNILLQNCKKKRFWDKGRHWKRYKNLGRTFILITFTLPIKDRGRHFQDTERNLTWLWRGLMLALNRSEYLRVTWIPKYLKRFLITLNWKSEYDIWREDEFSGNSSLLQKFCLYPEKLLKVSRIERVWGIEERGLDKKEEGHQHIKKPYALFLHGWYRKPLHWTVGQLQGVQWL